MSRPTRFVAAYMSLFVAAVTWNAVSVAYEGPEPWMIRLLAEDDGTADRLGLHALASTPAWVGEGDQDGAAFGRYVSRAGDVNGDGFDDVIVGVPGFDNGHQEEGAARLYLGSPEGPSATPDWTIEGGQAGAYAGLAVSTAGDVNGDGYDDVIIGLPYLGGDGGAWVFHGSASGLSSDPDWIGPHATSGSRYGYSVDTAGDVNGDGYDDVIVGAYLATAGQTQEGKVYVYHGSAFGLSLGSAWTAEGNQVAAQFGISAGAAGDLDGDGYDDVIVGAWNFHNGQSLEGRAFVYHGSVDGLSPQPNWTYENNVVQACLGGSVGTAGDVDGDGFDDVIVGAAYQACTDAPSSPLGKAYVFHGSASGLPDTPTWEAELAQTGSMFGRFVSTAGDVNGDTYDDVLVGAILYDGSEPDEGAAFLYLGAENGLGADSVWIVTGHQEDARLGMVSEAGRVDDDGFDDALVGARKFDNGEVDEGRAYLYVGAPGDLVPAGWVPNNTPLLLAKEPGGALQLTWGASCLEGDSDYEIYQGEFGDFMTYTPRLCSTGGATTSTFFLFDPEDMFFLVVPRSPSAEGSYGRTSDDLERSPGNPSCLPQAIGECE